jgi:hypothetical protein
MKTEHGGLSLISNTRGKDTGGPTIQGQLSKGKEVLSQKQEELAPVEHALGTVFNLQHCRMEKR